MCTSCYKDSSLCVQYRTEIFSKPLDLSEFFQGFFHRNSFVQMMLLFEFDKQNEWMILEITGESTTK